MKQLLDLGFDFQNKGKGVPTKAQTTVPELPFERRMQSLQRIKSYYGHLNIDFRCSKMDNIGGWCTQISQCYKEWQEGKRTISPLQEQQFNQLRDLGFEFNVIFEARSRRSWEENFNAFLQVRFLIKVLHSLHCMPID